MPIEVKWLNKNKQVILLNFVGGHVESWNEYNEAVDEAWALADEVEYPVVAIFAAYNTPMPVGSPVPHMRRALMSQPANIVMNISIVERTFEKLMIDMVAEMKLSRKIQTVTSWDDVNKLLKADNLPIVPLEDVPQRK